MTSINFHLYIPDYILNKPMYIKITIKNKNKYEYIFIYIYKYMYIGKKNICSIYLSICLSVYLSNKFNSSN